MRGLGMDSRLEAIAGNPAGILTAPGSVQLGGFGNTGDRTMYFVYDRLIATSNSWYPIATLGAMAYTPGASGPLIGVSNGTSLASNQLRYNNGATTVFRDLLYPSAVGRYVGAVWTDFSTGKVAGVIRGGAEIGSGNIPGLALDDAPKLFLSVGNSYLTNLLAVAYRGKHNFYQRTAIMAKLLQMVA